MKQILPEEQAIFVLTRMDEICRAEAAAIVLLNAHGYPHASCHSNMLVLAQFDSNQIALLVTLMISSLVQMIDGESTENGDHSACAEPARFASLLCPSGRCLGF